MRLIQKWLNAGVLEEGKRTRVEEGTPQGGSASPLLANIYLHYVFDLWAQSWRRKHTRGDMIVVRFADDIVVGFQSEADAERYMAQLPAGETLNVETVLNAGIKLYNEGNLDAALVQFERAVQENPGAAEPYYYRGLVHIARERSEQAAADFRKFLELAPQHEKAAEAREFLSYLEPN